MGDFRARVTHDFPQNVCRLQVACDRHDGVELLMEKGSWMVFTDGALPTEPAGIVLPPEALEAIAEALAKHLGNALPSQAEVAVLREWLTAERSRVDAILRAHHVGATSEEVRP